MIDNFKTKKMSNLDNINIEMDYFKELNLELENLHKKIETKLNLIEIPLINDMFNKIKTLLNKINENLENDCLKKYEPQLLNNEKEIRERIKNIFIDKNYIIILENKIKSLEKKEEEYEQLKKITNFSIENGKFVLKDIKENEISILKSENSNLKKIIIKYEKQLEKKIKREIELETIKSKLEKKLKSITYSKLTNHVHSNSNLHLNDILNDLSHSNLIPVKTGLNKIKFNKKLEYLSTSLNDSKSNLHKTNFSEKKNQNKLTLTISYSNRNDISLNNPHKRIKSDYSSIETDFSENFFKKRITPIKKNISHFINKENKGILNSEINSSHSLKIPYKKTKNNVTKRNEKNNHKNNISNNINDSLVNNFLTYKKANLSISNNHKEKSFSKNNKSIRKCMSRNIEKKHSGKGSMMESFRPPIKNNKFQKKFL
jgi:hypothetical protein